MAQHQRSWHAGAPGAASVPRVALEQQISHSPSVGNAFPRRERCRSSVFRRRAECCCHCFEAGRSQGCLSGTVLVRGGLCLPWARCRGACRAPRVVLVVLVLVVHAGFGSTAWQGTAPA